MPEQWFVAVQGQQHGPYLFDEIRAFATEERITPDTQLRKGENGGWFSAGHIAGLFSATAVVPALVSSSAYSVPSRSHFQLSTGLGLAIGGVALGVACIVAALIVARSRAPVEKQPATSVAKTDDAVQQADLMKKAEAKYLPTEKLLAAIYTDGTHRFQALVDCGFVLKFDKEARNVIVDHQGWMILTEFENTRRIAATTISERMRWETYIEAEWKEKKYAEQVLGKIAAGKVTIFSSKTGQSLAYFGEDDTAVHILR